MPTPQGEQVRLLALAESEPLQALHASAGRLRRIQRDAHVFLGVYVPSPVNDEYMVVLNATAPFEERARTLRALVRHHVEDHDSENIYVLRRDTHTCSACRRAARKPPGQLNPLEQRERSMRRLRAY